MNELIAQLEFFRDIGVTTLELSRPKPKAEKEAAPAEVPPAPAVVVPARSRVELSPLERLQAVRDEIGDCQRCKLAPTRTNIVFGSGNPNADLVFIGEAPGSDEDEQGLPFVGRAGQLLTKIIESIDPGNLKREDVYICNILKCRPPNNRNPEPDEVQTCSPFLRQQLAAIRPKVVCCLGKFAAQYMLKSETPISALRGTFHDMDGMRVIATFHPAYLLRSPDKKREVWEDMKQIRAELARLRA